MENHIHRIKSIRQTYAPGHTAFRRRRRTSRRSHKICKSKTGDFGKPPPALANNSCGSLNVRKAVDFASQCRVGSLAFLIDIPRCRSPPSFEFFKIQMKWRNDYVAPK